MEKNLVENSGSFARRDEHNNSSNNAGDTPRSPMPDIAEVEVDPKPDDVGETAEAEEAPPQEPEAQPEEGDDEKNEEKKEEEVVEEEESPPPSLEMVSDEIDQWLLNLQQNNNDDDDNYNKEGSGSFEIPSFVEKFLYLVEEKIVKYDTGEGKPKWGEVAEEDSWLLETVDRISKLTKSVNLTPPHHQSEEEKQAEEEEEIIARKHSLVNRIGSIQQRAMSYLEEDFRLLMDESRNPITELDPGGNKDPDPDHHQPAESETNFPGYPDEAIATLTKIATEMISSGYESECCQVYIVSRRNAFEEIQQKLGLEKISIDEMVQKVQWETLARDMIPAWINTFKQCAAVYFPGERKLAEAVFAENPSVSAGLFSSLTRGVVIQLLNFAEGAAMTKRAGEKLFKILDMYETLRDLIPELDGLFPEESVEELKTEMLLAKSRLGELAISIFCDLENSIKSETGRTPVPGGAVHPLTRYIMNYLNIAGDYKETLEQVFKEYSKIERADSTSRPHHENEAGGGSSGAANVSSPFAAQVMRVMELLDSSLEGKAKLYRDVALSNFFMMNNGRYILQKIKASSEMSKVMGDTWCRKRSSELRTYHKNYQRETWNRVLTCLTHEGLSVHGKVQKPVLKERFKSFNALFDEIHRTQSQWVVKDEQLQSELRVSISAVVIPAYRSFLGRFAQILDPGRQTEKYIKYQPEDIETYVDELFDGKPHQSITKRKT
ncbi:exocyst complex component EXO70C2-like [Gastrolobium bilobum]|uniref:exocyst complex component EXO70C2-like n=1 Tax=Gastrolobium bilobum TaxID=150636 RepID=UPI002AB165D3|nr:exocyst complex component EXO70C2-like [Gastrolobium bilobum]